MGRTFNRHGRLEPLLFFLVSALILVARVAYQPLPNWTNHDAVGAKHLFLRSPFRKGVWIGPERQTGRLYQVRVGSLHSKLQLPHTRRMNGRMLATVFHRTIHRARNETGKPRRRLMQLEVEPAPASAPAQALSEGVAVRGFEVVSSVVDTVGQLSLQISASPSPSSTFSFHVDPTVQQVVVAALPATSTASMSVNGQLITDGRPSNPITILVGGVTHLPIELAPISGSPSLFYTLTLLKPSSPAPSPSQLPPQPLTVGTDLHPLHFPSHYPAATPSSLPFPTISITSTSAPPAARLPTLPASSLVGVAYDGYLANCVLFADANLNGVQDASEVGTTTGASGQFLLDGYTGGPIILNPQDSMRVQNCTDINTGVQLLGSLSAPPSSTSISPLSSILWQVLTLLPDLTQSEVNRIVTASLQIDGIDLANSDPIAAIVSGDVGGEGLARATLIRLVQVQSAVALGAAVLAGTGGGTSSLSLASAAVTESLAQALTQTFHPLAPPSSHVATGGRRKLWRQWKAEGVPRFVQFPTGVTQQLPQQPQQQAQQQQQGLTVDLTEPTHIYSMLVQSAALYAHAADPVALSEGTAAIVIINAELDALLNQSFTGQQFLTAVFATSAVGQGMWVNRIRTTPTPTPATSSSSTPLTKSQFMEDLAYTLETNLAVSAQASCPATALPTAPTRAPASIPALSPTPSPSPNGSGGVTGWWATSLWLKVAFCAAVGLAALLLLFIFCNRCLPCCCCYCCFGNRGRAGKQPLPLTSAPGPRNRDRDREPVGSRPARHWHLDCLGLPGGSTPSSPTFSGSRGQPWGGGSRVSEIEVSGVSNREGRAHFFGFGTPLPMSDDQIALVPPPTPDQHSSSIISLCSSNSTAPSIVGEDGNTVPPGPPLSQALLQRLGLRGGWLSPWEEGEGNSGAFSHRAEADPEEVAEQSMSSDGQSEAHWVVEVEVEEEQAVIPVVMPIVQSPPDSPPRTSPTAVMTLRRAGRSPERAGGRGEESPPLLYGRSRLGLPTLVTEEEAEDGEGITGEGTTGKGVEEEKETAGVEEAHGPGWEAAYVSERLELLKSGASRLSRERFGGDQILRPGMWEPLESDSRHKSGGEEGNGDTVGPVLAVEES